MAYRENAKILKADCLADGVYEIWFETKDIAKAAKAGQFISVYSNDGSRMLPRPISICKVCLLYTSPSPRDGLLSRMPSSA